VCLAKSNTIAAYGMDAKLLNFLQRVSPHTHDACKESYLDSSYQFGIGAPSCFGSLFCLF
jgi:hypothetical protein